MLIKELMEGATQNERRMSRRVDLGCTDAAPEEPHSHPTRRDAATHKGRRYLRAGAAPGRFLPCVFFSMTRADAAQTWPDSR